MLSEEKRKGTNPTFKGNKSTTQCNRYSPNWNFEIRVVPWKDNFALTTHAQNLTDQVTTESGNEVTSTFSGTHIVYFDLPCKIVTVQTTSKNFQWRTY